MNERLTNERFLVCFSTRNRVLVVLDWIKAKMFGRDVSRE
jgi:NADH:ubiquinone reductase (non-electrogenic)